MTRITNRGSRDYKTGQKGLQIEAGSEVTKWGKRITNRDKRITNQGRDYKMGQKDYKSGQGLQIGAEHMCRYKVKQHLIVLKLDSVSINKILVTNFVTMHVSQNLNFM